MSGAWVFARKKTTTATAVATAPDTNARNRKSSRNCGSVVSIVKYDAARYAKRASAKIPTAIGNGWNHGVMNTDAKSCPCGRMPPDVTAPTVMPKRMGVTTLADENTVPQRLCTSSRLLSYVRNVNAEPRNTIPTNIRVSGICSTVVTKAKATGNAVNRMTTTRMSQT